MRRVAVLADIHANRVALDAVLRDADACGVDEFVVAGDVCGFGPEPDTVVDILMDRNAHMIRGNHEADYVAAFDGPTRPIEWQPGPRYASLLWNMACLGLSRRAALAGLPDRATIADAAAVHHGSARGNRDGLYPWTRTDTLEVAFADEPLALAFVGHTHHSFDRRLPSGRRVVNAGSVGLPLDGIDARYVTVDVDDTAAAGWTIEVRRVPYDIEAAVAAFTRQAGDVPAEFRDMLVRTLRTGRDCLGPGLRFARGWPPDRFLDAIRAYLSERA